MEDFDDSNIDVDELDGNQNQMRANMSYLHASAANSNEKQYVPRGSQPSLK